MGTTSSHIQGIWGVIGAIVAALVTGAIGVFAGKSWEASMAEKIYDDNKGIIGNNPNLIFKGQKLIIK